MGKETISPKRILVVTAVEAEREAVWRGVEGDPRFYVAAGGAGPAAAAAFAARELAAGEYGLVVSAGIGGGFPDRAPVGAVVVASEIVAADLGAESPEGFIGIDELGFGIGRVRPPEGLADELAAAMRESGIEALAGPVLTVATATGTAETARKLAERVEGAAAEAMEGFGVAAAARLFGRPVMEIRGISNAVGPRDRAAWRIGDALKALEAAGRTLKEWFR
ncbi:futalosine hydrolase [Paenibacillus thermoaerophilus]|uniref:Futalosine hydrolase n=1 Tax=Paenibacillus thermoaerophilus TaxID=1215385 RepID=A0ABW2V2F0_9BACL|nr:futalosine hydrolase [Paenibacillus thermoaerophilus]TMV18821.1 futalosine hydrolase [Paenibacillus thermoaerophilus]